MSIFGFGKKMETEKEDKNNCDCGASCDTASMENPKESRSGDSSVKVLGSGCAKCNELEANVKTALVQFGMDTEIEHVSDFLQIASYGVMSTPALVIDGKVVSFGKVLKVEECKKILEKVRS